MVLVPDPVISLGHGLHRQLSHRRFQRNQLAAGEFLGRAAFIGVDVG